MSHSLMTFLVLFACFFSNFQLVAQDSKKLTYGGKDGTRFNASVQVHYFISDQNKKVVLKNSDQVIDLNEYEGTVTFGVQFKNLKTGLNSSFDKVKNSSHEKVFYLEAVADGSKAIGYRITNGGSVKIGGKTSSYSSKNNYLSFKIDNISNKKKLTFKVKTKMVDGIYNRAWYGSTFSKNLTFLPKKIVEDKKSTKDKSQTKRVQKKKRNTTYRRALPEEVTDTIPESEKEKMILEALLLSQIEKNLDDDDTTLLLQNCQSYLEACEALTNTCDQKEDVLFYIITSVEYKDRIPYAAIYNEEFPNGKYCSRIQELLEVKVERFPPIIKGLGHMDFDTEMLEVNNIKGGKKPYYIGFFDLNKSKEHAIKSVRFIKNEKQVFLENLEMPYGSYLVKVYDSKGTLFVKSKRLFLKEFTSIPKSVKLCIFLGIIGCCVYLYKRFIHY